MSTSSEDQRRNLEAKEGTTVLETARAHGIEIPTLCNHPDLRPVGSCRLCLVEIGRRQTGHGLHTSSARGLSFKPKLRGWWKCGRRFWNCFWRIMPMPDMPQEIASPPNLRDG